MGVSRLLARFLIFIFENTIFAPFIFYILNKNLINLNQTPRKNIIKRVLANNQNKRDQINPHSTLARELYYYFKLLCLYIHIFHTIEPLKSIKRNNIHRCSKSQFKFILSYSNDCSLIFSCHML